MNDSGKSIGRIIILAVLMRMAFMLAGSARREWYKAQQKKLQGA